MATKDLSTLFGGKRTEELEKMILSPYSLDKGGSGEVVLPAETDILDFELFEFTLGIGVSVSSYDYIELTKDEILGGLANTRLVYVNSTRTTQYECVIVIDLENNKFTWTGRANGTSSNVYPLIVSGRKKKYATTNLSVVLDVNGGNDITVNSRYEIPASALPANFLESDGSIKKNVIVRAEINISGSLYSGWAEYSKVLLFGGTPTYQTYGVECQVVNNKLLVFTGNNSGVLALPSSQITNAWGNSSDITSAPCRVVATLAGEAYTVQTA